MPKTKKRKNNATELSCIIITLNEEEHLPKLLDSLKKQTFKEFEIIVADYNSTDKTREIAKKYGCKVTLGGGYSAGRNNGAKISKGEYLLFLDADSVLPIDFLEINFKQFKKSGNGTGTVPLKPLSDRKFDKVFFRLYDYWSKAMSKVSPHCAGCGIFARKDIFQKIGGFNESVVFAENHDFTKRAKDYGFIILPRHMHTSVRRMDEEGRLKFVGKYVYAGLYRLFNKEITQELFNYEFESNKPTS